MILGIDCDSVLFPFSEHFVPFAENKLLRQLEYPTKFKMYERWGITEEKWNELYQEFIENNELLINKPYPQTVETLQALHDRGHKILIITHRIFPGFSRSLREKMVTDTIEWLEGNNLYFDDLLFMKDKYLVRVDILFDDAIHNLEKVILPTIPVAIEQPWNTEWKGYKIPKFSNSLDLVDLLGSNNKFL
jgi:5'(3')-deoxyribonucleotidase